MDCPAKLREEYTKVVLQHHHDIMKIGVHILRERNKKNREKLKRKCWIRSWIDRRKKYGVYDKLMMEI